MKYTLTCSWFFLKRRILQDLLERNKDKNYILLYQKREKCDWDKEDVYNIWVYEQKNWCISTKSSLDDVLKSLDKWDNIQSLDVDLLPNQ